MAWQFDLNYLRAGGQPGEDSTGAWFFRLKGLIATHWPAGAVRGSGDGLAAFEDIDQATGGAGTGPGGAYDVITQESNWGGGSAGDMGNESAWFRFREPGSTREWIFQRTSVFGSFGQGEDDIIIVFSPTGFTGGAPNATTRPTAVDEEVIHNGQYGQSNAYAQASVIHVGLQDAADPGGVYAFFIAVFEQGGSNMTQALIYDGVSEGLVGDTQPWVLMTTEDFNNLEAKFRFYDFGGTLIIGDGLALKDGANTLVAPNGVPVQADGLERQFPIPIWSNTGTTWKGILRNWKWKGSSTREYPDTRDLATANARVYMNLIVGPWAQGIVPST